MFLRTYQTNGFESFHNYSWNHFAKLMKGFAPKFPESFGNFTGIIFRNVCLRNYKTDYSEIWYSYVLGLSNELPICPGPKYAEFPEKIPEYEFFRNVRNFVRIIVSGLCPDYCVDLFDLC